MILEKPVLVQDAGINWIQSNSTDTNVFALCITSTGRIIASFFGNGIWYSDDNGVNWTRSIETTDAQMLCITATGRIIAANIYYQSYILCSDDNGETWSQINITGMNCGVLYVLPTGQIIASGSSGTYRSSDNGVSWTRLDNDSDKFYFSEIHRTVTGRLIVGNANKWGIWYSDDNGETWVQSNKTNNHWSGLCTTKTGKIIVANTENDIWLYSDNDGATWSQIDSNNVTSGQVAHTCVTSNGRIVAICNNFSSSVFSVWYSDDNGVNWAQAQQSIETQEPWQVIRITNTGRIVIGGHNIGVYYSDPTYTMRDTYMSKPLTGAQARQLVAECKEYVQELKQS